MRDTTARAVSQSAKLPRFLVVFDSRYNRHGMNNRHISRILSSHNALPVDKMNVFLVVSCTTDTPPLLRFLSITLVNFVFYASVLLTSPALSVYLIPRIEGVV